MSLYSGVLYDKVKQTYNEYEATQPQLFKNAQAYIAQHDTATCASNFADATEAFNEQQYGTLGSFDYTHYAFTDSTTWWKESNTNGATCVNITSMTSFGSTNSDYSTFSESASASYFGFSGGQYYDHNHSSLDIHMDQTRLEVSFCYQRVDIYRRWLNGDIISGTKWYLPDEDANFFSTGKKETANANKRWPWTPNSFIVAKDIKVCNQFSSSDQNKIHDSTAAGAEFSLNVGFFSAKSKVDATNGHDGFTTKAKFDGSCFTNFGTQIIAWMGSVNPSSPPQKAP